MRFLLSEAWDSDLAVVTEAVDEGGAKKSLYITGPFAQAEVVNRNKRSYSKTGMENAVSKYIKEYVDTRQSLGELNHPNRMSIDPREASHLITELKWDGNNVMGKAKILSNGMGPVVRGLVEDGVNIGVSTRGVGSVSMMEGVSRVGDDFYLKAVDVVTDPSGPDCFVNGLMEGVEWICESGVWRSQDIEKAQAIVKATPTKEVRKMTIDLWETFVGHLSKVR